MSTKLDDVHLNVKIKVDQEKGKPGRPLGPGGRRIPGQRPGPGGRHVPGTNVPGGHRIPGMGPILPGARGIGMDLAQGRTPGLGRFGRGAVKVAGFLAMLKVIEVLADAASGVPVIGEVAKSVSTGLKTGKHEIASAFGAIEDTKNILLGRQLAGKSASVGDAQRIFDRERKTRVTLGQADLARDIITAEFIAPIAVKALAGAFKSMLLAAMEDPEVKRKWWEVGMDVIIGPITGPALRRAFR